MTGGFAERFAVPAAAAVRLDADLSDEVATLTEPLANAVHVASRSVEGGDRVFVIGAGPIGVLMVKAAFLYGAGRVLITDPVVRPAATGRRAGRRDRHGRRPGAGRHRRDRRRGCGRRHRRRRVRGHVGAGAPRGPDRGTDPGGRPGLTVRNGRLLRRPRQGGDDHRLLRVGRRRLRERGRTDAGRGDRRLRMDHDDADRRGPARVPGVGRRRRPLQGRADVLEIHRHRHRDDVGAFAERQAKTRIGEPAPHVESNRRLVRDGDPEPKDGEPLGAGPRRDSLDEGARDAVRRARTGRPTSRRDRPLPGSLDAALRPPCRPNAPRHGRPARTTNHPRPAPSPTPIQCASASIDSSS